MEPCAVIASTCTDIISPERIIKGILEVDDLPCPLEIVEGFRNYAWNISTKYYNAKIHLCAMNSKTIGNLEFAESVNAIILCFDSNKDNGLAVVDEWMVFTKELNAEIKILVCERCSEHSSNDPTSHSSSGISRNDAQKWCVKNGFELVELSPEPNDPDSETEDDFPETLGIQRIIQALHAHVWPNLSMKSEGSSRTNTNTHRPQNDSAKKVVPESGENFEMVFQNLSMLKSKADNLPPSERKSYAEKVAVAFWKAMGGSDSEIDDLSEEEDSVKNA